MASRQDEVQVGRGFLNGTLIGALTALVIGGLWLKFGQQVYLAVTPPENVAAYAPSSAQQPGDSETTPETPQAAAMPSTDPGRQVPKMAPGTVEQLPTPETTPAEVPASPATEIAQLGQNAKTNGQPLAVDPTAEVPVLPNPLALAPKVPGSDPMPSGDTAPPVAAPTPTPAEEQPVASLDVEPETAPSTAPPAPVGSVAEIEQPSEPDQPPQALEPVESAEAPTIIQPLPEMPLEQPPVVEEMAPEGTAEAPDLPEADAEVDDKVAEAPAAIKMPQIIRPNTEAEADEGTSDTKLPGRVVVGLGNKGSSFETDSGVDGLAPNVITNRLPSIGDDAATDPGQNAEISDALMLFSAPFENPDQRPVMAIILIDEGGSLFESEINALPFKATIAIDANLEDAADRMDFYRDAGHEVALIAQLPEGASMTDVEVALSAATRTMPQAMAIMDVRTAAFQSSRQVAAQVVSFAQTTGHGLVTFARGLNSVSQEAKRENVPAGIVFRDFDSDGQDGSTIKRFLDQAAFRAGSEQGGVIMVGHLRDTTLAAIMSWTLGNRAASVALAPVSAVLNAKEAP